MAETIALAKLVVKVKYLRAILFTPKCSQDKDSIFNSTCVWVDDEAALADATGNNFRTRL